MRYPVKLNRTNICNLIGSLFIMNSNKNYIWIRFLIFFTDLEDLLGFLDVKKQETRLNCASKHGVSTNLFVTSKNESSNSPIHEIKVLQKNKA